MTAAVYQHHLASAIAATSGPAPGCLAIHHHHANSFISVRDLKRCLHSRKMLKLLALNC